jgi:hypothetical protein
MSSNGLTSYSISFSLKNCSIATGDISTPTMVCPMSAIQLISATSPHTALMENTIEAKDMKELFDVDYEVTDLGVVSGYAPEYDDTQFQFFRICGSN